MRTTWILFTSSLKMFLRKKQTFFFTLFMPAMIMIIFGFIGFDSDLKINIGVVSEDPDVQTQQFIDKLHEIETFVISENSYDEEIKALEDGERALVMKLPDQLMSVDAQPAEIDIKTSISQQQYAGTAISIISQMLDKITIQAANIPPMFDIKNEAINSNDVDYIDFLLPGIICMSVMQMSVFSVAFVFVTYREKGVLKRLLATPMRPWQFVTANVFTRLIIALAQVGILMALGIIMFEVTVQGSFFSIALIATLGSIMFLGLGFTISGLSKTVETVPALANIIVFPMLFLSGIFFPTDSMPDWLQNTVQYLPLTYFAHAMREVMANGVAISEISTDILWMIIWAIILVALSILTFNFADNKS